MKSYAWQKEIEDHKGDLTIRGGRQSGKSIAVSKRIKKLMKEYPGSTHLLLAATERQENFLLDKVVNLIGKDKSNYIGRRTLSHFQLKDGKSHLYKFPVGVSGVYIEGMSSVDFIYIDEAIHVGHKVFDSIIPMLVEPKKRGLGWITLLSATRGRPKGHFYDSFKILKNYKQIQIKTADVPHADLDFLKQEKLRLGDRMFGVIYEGEFDENAHKYFPKEKVQEAVERGKKKMGVYGLKKIGKWKRYFCGIDPALAGRCKAAWAVAELESKECVNLVYGEEEAKSSMINLRDNTKKLDLQFHKFKKLYIDNGGLGQGFVDVLEDIKGMRYRIVALNNKAATLEKGKILKEDLYSNTLRLLELGYLNIVDDPILIKGLLDAELDPEERIMGTDMSEAITRALWCVKGLNIKTSIRSF